MNVLSLFGGIECGRIAADIAGLRINNYYSSEVNKNAISVSSKNYPDIVHLGDVTKWREWDLDWSAIDLLIGGSPCQGFSRAGNELNFKDPRSKLFFVFVDILNHIKSVNPNITFMLENVKMRNEHINIISDHLAVEPVAIDGKSGYLQARPRLYWANFNIKKIISANTTLYQIYSTICRPAILLVTINALLELLKMNVVTGRTEGTLEKLEFQSWVEYSSQRQSIVTR